MAFEGPLEDRVALQELVQSYADAVCRLSPTEITPLFAEDAEWHHPMVGSSVGQAAIVAMIGDAMKNYTTLVFTCMQGSLRIDGDHATGRNYTSELVTDLKGATVRVTGRYDDHYVKREGRWLFKSRAFHHYHSG